MKVKTVLPNCMCYMMEEEHVHLGPGTIITTKLYYDSLREFEKRMSEKRKGSENVREDKKTSR